MKRIFLLLITITITTIQSFSQGKKNPCVDEKENLVKLTKELKEEIANCNVEKARIIHDKITSDYVSCMGLLQQDEHSDMLIQIIVAEKAIKENLGLRSSIESDLKSGNCQNAQKTLDILKTKKLCISTSLKEFMDKTEIDIKVCNEEENIRMNERVLDEYFSTYTKLGISKLVEMESNAAKIITFLESKKIENSKIESYKSKKKELSKYIIAKTEEEEKANKIRDNKYFGKIFKPEIVLGTSTFKPIIANLGAAGELVTPSIGLSKNKPSVGVVLRRYNRDKNKGFRFGVMYSQTDFNFINPDTLSKTEEFKFNYLDVQFVKTFSNNKNYHPLYLNVGVGGNLPISVEYTNYLGANIKSEAFKSIDQFGYSIFTLFGLGTGFERKDFGISLEYNVKFGGFASPFIKNTETAVIRSEKLSSFYMNSNISLLFRVW